MINSISVKHITVQQQKKDPKEINNASSHDIKDWLEKHPKTKAALKGAVFGLTTTVATPLVLSFATRLLPVEMGATLFLGTAGAVGSGEALISQLTSEKKVDPWKVAGKTAAASVAGTAVVLTAVIAGILSFPSTIKMLDRGMLPILAALAGGTGAGALGGLAYKAISDAVSPSSNAAVQ